MSYYSDDDSDDTARVDLDEGRNKYYHHIQLSPEQQSKAQRLATGAFRCLLRSDAAADLELEDMLTLCNVAPTLFRAARPALLRHHVYIPNFDSLNALARHLERVEPDVAAELKSLHLGISPLRRYEDPDWFAAGHGVWREGPINLFGLQMIGTVIKKLWHFQIRKPDLEAFRPIAAALVSVRELTLTRAAYSSAGELCMRLCSSGNSGVHFALEHLKVAPLNEPARGSRHPLKRWAFARPTFTRFAGSVFKQLTSLHLEGCHLASIDLIFGSPHLRDVKLYACDFSMMDRQDADLVTRHSPRLVSLDVQLCKLLPIEAFCHLLYNNGGQLLVLKICWNSLWQTLDALEPIAIATLTSFENIRELYIISEQGELDSSVAYALQGLSHSLRLLKVSLNAESNIGPWLGFSRTLLERHEFQHLALGGLPSKVGQSDAA